MGRILCGVFYRLILKLNNFSIKETSLYAVKNRPNMSLTRVKLHAIYFTANSITQTFKNVTKFRIQFLDATVVVCTHTVNPRAKIDLKHFKFV